MCLFLCTHAVKLDLGLNYGTDRNYPVQHSKLRSAKIMVPDQDGATVKHDFDRNLTVWLQLGSKYVFLFATIVYE